MHINPQHTLDRLARVLRERLAPRVHTRLSGVQVRAWQVDGDGEPVPAAHALGLDPLPGRAEPRFEPFGLGAPWGPAWGTTWFRIDGTLPEPDDSIVELLIDLGWEDHSVGGQCEGLAYRPDGTAIKGLHPRAGWIRLTGPGAAPGVVRPDRSFTVFVEAAANPLVLGRPPFVVTDLGEKQRPSGETSFEPYRLRQAELAAFHPEIWELVRDLEVAGGLAEQLSPDEPRYWRVLMAVDEALDALDPREPVATAGRARLVLSRVLDQPAHATAHRATATGHAHIDSAWLWPLRETERKVARTVANVLALMDADQSLVYAMSSAQQYEWLEHNHPDLFARLRDRVAEGRFVPVGGMWVESDVMMPTGEAIVRQFTRGKRYFLDRFGVEPREVWLPDSFGYSGALPQLARRAGFRWFLTQKLSWNDTNPFPHHTFQWEGIDGTRIFTHFPPVDTYIAEITAAELGHAVRNFRDKPVSSHSLVPFGYGDGGGGPTREMLARARRFTDLEGAARVEVRAPAEFFADAEAELAAAGADPVWLGELYLELHRGTLTSQRAMKRGNRRAEALLRTAEYLATTATVTTGAVYPARELDEVWATVLLHQFHDILPGSAIAWVHREARETYHGLEERLHELIARSVKALDGNPDQTPGALVPIPGRDTSSWVIRRREQPAAASPSQATTTTDGEVVLDNDVLRVTVDATGHVRSVRDLAAGREVVPPGQRLGLLRLFRDEPVRWDAWDIDRHTYRLGTDLVELESLTSGVDGAGVAEVVVERKFGEACEPNRERSGDACEPNRKHSGEACEPNREHRGDACEPNRNHRAESRVRVAYRLAPGARRLDMVCEVDWHEREQLLKVCLPLAVHAATARYETQYGYVERPTHQNTSWDEARYESCQHRYLHLAESGYGVGVVNDSSYGADVSRLPGPSGGTLVRLSLLRGPRFPDPDTDRGEHRLQWSVVCAPDQADTVAAAYELNAPELGSVPDLDPLAWLDLTGGLAVLDWVKLADDGSGDVVVRVYEALGGRATGRLRLSERLGADPPVVETDLLERPAAQPDLPPALRDGQLELGPFQVATLRIHVNTDEQ